MSNPTTIKNPGTFEASNSFKGLLVIDDFGAKQPSNITIDQVYMILNKRYECMLPTIITSNLALEEIGNLFGERIASRIERMSISFKL